MRVQFHFDVMCPWAYQTSLWMREVRDIADVEVDWRFFSLEEINRAEGKKHPWERAWSYGWSMMRIGALLRRTDMALLDQWYLATGNALHVEGRKPQGKSANYAGKVMCFFEVGDGKGTMLQFDYDHPPKPPKPNRFWHLGKIVFNKTYWYTVPRGRI